MTVPFIPDPRYLSFDDWGLQLLVNVTDEALAPPPAIEAWKDWAAYLCQTSALSVYPVPDPYQFEAWDRWALSLLQSVN